MASIETEHHPKSPTSLFFLDDCLYCQEEKFWDEEDLGLSSLSSEFDVCSPEEDEDQLLALFSKEKKITHFSEDGLDASRKAFMVERREILDWMKRVSAHHDFSANVMVLGVNYFDRFMSSFGFRVDWPWLTQLAAIACLSLASKIEETSVPPLLDFQVDCKYNFEAKRIQKMELLVLSTLEWKMNAVTPLSFFGHLIKRLKLKTHLLWELLCRFESLILSAILDSRYLYYFPSVLAAATMVQALKELEILNPLEDQIQLMDMFKISQDKVEECYKFIQEMSMNNKTLKRKYINSVNSPKNVLDISSLLPSLEPLPKKRKD